jgi:DNA segregation ATPase FtsK/SpoIIIE, S-DNA-T family
MDKILLTPDERELVQSLLRKGLRLQRTDPQWLVARLALARSLQLSDAPDKEFGPPPYKKGGSELHYEQVTGEGKGAEDLTDVFKAILSAYHNRDLFDDQSAFEDAMQRHIRRGLSEISASWRENFDFHDYLFQEMYFELAGEGPAGSAADSAGLRERIGRVLGQLGIGADIEAYQEGPRLTRLTLELHELDDLDRFRRGLDKLAFALGMGENALSASLAPGERRMFLDVPRPTATWKTVTWQDVKGALASPTAGAMSVPICLGTDVLGEPFVRDLAEAPHLFIGGTTGSGKSMCLHATAVAAQRSAPTARTGTH